jgi:GNAT superfamily N-acetyltransferase
MQGTYTLSRIMDLIAAAPPLARGTTVQHVGPVRWVHFEKPLWWESDSFRAFDVEPAEVVRIVKSCEPGPHLIRVVTTDPEGVIAPYAQVGYKTNGPLETIMARGLMGFVPGEERYPVQCVQSEAQRHIYNSMIDPEDPHGQMRPEELADPTLRHYFVELESLCVCYAKAIRSVPRVVIVEPLGTREGYRRRGIATALMNRLHADAAEGGVEHSVLHASPMGVPFYTAIGYQTVGYVQKFVPQDWNPADYP